MQSSKNDSKLRKGLKRSAEARGLTPGTERYNRYVYGGMYAVLKKGGKGKSTGKAWVGGAGKGKGA